MPSFDVVSKVAMHEVENAVQQAQKEYASRYDFRGAEASIEKTDAGIMLRANSEGRVDAALDVLREKLARRQVSLKAIEAQAVEPAGGKMFRCLVKLNQGISQEKAKLVVKSLKDSKLKVQAAIQGDQVRVTGKKRDDLQAAIAHLRGADLDVDLQFENFRD